jgi:1-pyrroline-5-carboxylate dehydrogenase
MYSPGWKAPRPANDVDTIPLYASGTRQRERLIDELARVRSETHSVPIVIGGEELEGESTYRIRCPHDTAYTLAEVQLASPKQLGMAVESCFEAWRGWSEADWVHRVAVFTRAADMLAGPMRIRAVAEIMVNHSKNPYEAEIDLAELIDFLRLNAYYVGFIYGQQPDQFPGESNRFDWRPLEGFVLAVPPFNFYSIGGNLPTAPAMVGNVAVWKPSRVVAYSNYGFMRVLMDAGLPAGVVNFVPFDSRHSGVLLGHRRLAGLHFTGSYQTLVGLQKSVAGGLGGNIGFPRVVGEAGGKGFIFAHESAEARSLVVALLRGAYGYQGQKCSACSRAYVPRKLWCEVKPVLVEEVSSIPVGRVEELGNYLGAVIDEAAFEKSVEYIEYAKAHPAEYTVIVGGGYDSSKGWFVEPTVIETSDPKGRLMSEEIFGPVLTVYVYTDGEYGETLKVCDSTSPYALTGAVLARDRSAIAEAERVLRYSAGNFYINDKPTGAVVGRQPFGGARASGTDDKAGSWLNLLRWLAPRTIKETTTPPTEWRHPFMG